MLNHALHGGAAFEQIVLSAMPADCHASCDILHYVHNSSQSSESEDIRNQGSLCKEPQPSFHYRLITELYRRRNLFGGKTIYFDATSPA